MINGSWFATLAMSEAEDSFARSSSHRSAGSLKRREIVRAFEHARAASFIAATSSAPGMCHAYRRSNGLTTSPFQIR